MNKKNLIGRKFGRLTVITDSGTRSFKGDIIWTCLCDCGKTKNISQRYLCDSHVPSCGCWAQELNQQPRVENPRNLIKCSVDRCKNTIDKGGHGLCGKHYARFKRYGDVNYITPEDERRRRCREAQLKNISDIKVTTYRKFMGRHEHRVIAEQKIGRPLEHNEEVHHIDGNRHNNSPDNLEVLSKSEHDKIHAINRDLGHRPRGNYCNRDHEFTSENTRINLSGARVCKECQRIADRAYKAKKREKQSANTKTISN